MPARPSFWSAGVVAGLLVAALLTAGIARGVFALMDEAAQQSRQSTRAEDMDDLLFELEQALRAAQSSARAYVLLGGEVPLSQFNAQIEHAVHRLNRLDEALKYENERTRAALHRIRHLSSASLQNQASVVALRHRDGLRAAVAFLRAHDQQGIIATIRAEAAQLRASAHTAALIGELTHHDRRNDFQMVILGGAFGLFTVFAVMLIGLRRDAIIEQGLRRDLEGASDEARRRVVEATADLRDTNRVLSRTLKQVDERERRYRRLFALCPVALWESDMTGAKARLDELRASGVVDLRAHLERSPDVLWDIVSRARVLRVNEHTLALFQVESRAHLVSCVDRLFPEQERSTLAALVLALADGAPRRETELRVHRSDGDVRDVLMLVDLPPAGQSLSHVLLAFIDITARNRMQSKLRRSEQRHRALFENAGDMILIVDAKGRLTNVNPAALAVLGHGRASLVGNGGTRWLDEESSAIWRDALGAVFAGGAVRRVELGLRRRDGARLVAQATITPVQRSGPVQHCQAFLRDVTLERKNEQALRTTSRKLKALSLRLLERQEHERQVMANALHEDVGQDLAAVRMELQLLQAQAPSTLAGALARCGALLQGSLKRLKARAVALRPPMLESDGLGRSIDWYVRELSPTAGVTFRVQVEDLVPRPALGLELAVFRLVQSGVAAALRRQPSEVRIHLYALDDRLHLEFVEAGEDIPANDSHYTGDLADEELIERVRLLGGEVSIDMARGQGREILIEIPMQPDAVLRQDS